MEYPENDSNCSLYHVPHTLQISWKFVQSLFRNIANRQTDKHTTQATDNDENMAFAMAEVIRSVIS